MGAPRRIVGAFEAKTHLSRLLREVEQGESVTITVRGKAVADLVPSRGQEPEAPEQAVHAMRQFARVRDVAADQPFTAPSLSMKPTPRTVWIKVGWPGTSTFLRR